MLPSWQPRVLGGLMPECGDTLRDLCCTKVPTIPLILRLQRRKLVGISAGHERCPVPTSNPGHSL